MRTPAGYFLWGLVVKYTQITLLESRGMAIPDHDRALRYLSLNQFAA